ncbi:MAG TPA: glycosyltransferase family 39 protein [Acetobacteraceae bacterium]|nr:glycosyltransferase family 39 protein [Acetobacteraceae bacterium]
MRSRSILLVLLGASLLLMAVAWSRSAEYDEQYTLFLTGKVARPVWPTHVITVGEVRSMQSATANLASIASDLRTTDVHPPLYFWVISGWRRVAGDSLFVARLASVLCSIATLYLVALIARTAAIPAVPAMLLTAGCYGFAYTGSIARGFALAQMLSVAGVALLANDRRRPARMLIAGVLLGAATFANYLAAFVGGAAVLHALRRGPKAFTAVCIGFAAWLPADLWFFIAQRQSRTGQFAPFEPLAVIASLARYAVANLFGGLPLYAGGAMRLVVGAGVCILFVSAIGTIVWRWRFLAVPGTGLLLALCAIALPIGLVLLGVVFGNAPVELRYLAFATPYLGLLLAATLPRWLRYATLAVQAVALLGLMQRPETMQPARATARAAASLVGNGIVLVPRGNDGVGIVGAFANEAPQAMRILVIAPEATPEQIRAGVAQFSPVLLALMAQDSSSRATLPIMRAAFEDPCWRLTHQGANVLAYDQKCAGE